MIQNLNSVKIPKEFNGRNKFKVQLWYLVWLFLFRTSPHALNSFRIFLLKFFGASIGTGVKIKPSAYISYPWNIQVGSHSYIGDNVYLDSLTEISIGSHVSISNGVFITSGTHNISVPTFDLVLKPVHILDESWICVRSTLLPGSIVERGSIVGAGALITENTKVPENEIWAGVPAHFIKKRK